MNYNELKNLNKTDYVIAKVNVKSGITGAYNFMCSTVDRVGNIIDKISNLEKQNGAIFAGVGSAAGESFYCENNELINNLQFTLVSETEAQVLIKYNVFETTTLNFNNARI